MYALLSLSNERIIRILENYIKSRPNVDITEELDKNKNLQRLATTRVLAMIVLCVGLAFFIPLGYYMLFYLIGVPFLIKQSDYLICLGHSKEFYEYFKEHMNDYGESD